MTFSRSFISGLLLALLLLCSAAQTNVIARPDHVVLGYVPYWRDEIAAPENFNYDAFTHLTRAFLRPKVDGTLTVAPEYFNPKFEQAARDHGVKLLMSVGGESQTPDVWLAMARDPRHVQTFLDTLAGLFDAHHYDGVDIDWEPPPQNDADGRTYASLLQSIRQRFPDRLLMIAVSATNYGVGHLPLKDVLASVDYINVMTYDYSGPWTGIASFGANLHPDPTGANTRTSVEQGMHNLIDLHQVPPAKVLLGMTFWGYRFRVDHLGDRFPAHSKGYADFVEYPRAIDLLGTGRYTGTRDDVADASYLVLNDGRCVVTYDDPRSIRDKCDAARKLGCAGVMIWHVGADLGGGETPLLDAVAESFGATRSPVSRPALEQEVARLRGKPVPADETTESLLTSDKILRALRGKADDDRWIAAAPAATRPAEAVASQPTKPKP